MTETALCFTDARVDMDGGAWLCLKVKEPSAARALVYRAIKAGKTYQAKISDFRRPRSNDANRYFWKLCGELAAALHIPKEEVYIDLIQNIGDNFEIVSIRNEGLDAWVRTWSNRGLGWVCVVIGPSEEAGKTDVCNYYGSSTYDTKQMSNLIELVVQECRQQDIETLTPGELARMFKEP